MKRKISLILCVLLVFSLIPVEAFAGLSTGSATYREGAVLTGGNGCHYYSTDAASLGPSGGGLMQIYYFGDDGKKHIVYSYEVEGNKHAYMLKQNGESFRVYCFEHGLALSDNNPTYKSKNAASHPAFSGMKKSEQENLKYTVLYGYEADAPDKTLSSIGFFDSKYASRSKSSYNRDDWYMATQILVWEITQEYRKSSSGSDNLEYAGSSVHPVLKYGNGRNINIRHCYNIIKGKPAEDIYKYMIQMIKTRDNKPVKKSYDKVSEAEANPVSLKKDDDGKWSALVTGNTDVVKMYETAKRDSYGNVSVKNVDNIKGALEIEHISSKQYRITWTPPADKPDMKPSEAAKGKHYEIRNIIEGVSTANSLVLWFRDTKAGNIHDQSLVSGSSYQMRNTYYMSITDSDKEEPEPSEKKKPAVPSFAFEVTKEDLYGGHDDDPSTARGDATLAATFGLFRDGALVDSITLDSNGTTGTLEDKPYESGETFLDSSCEYGSRMHTDGDHECKISPTDCRWTWNAVYEVREINQPEGIYAEPDGKSVKTYKVNYDAHAENSQGCKEEGIKWEDTEIRINVISAEGTAEVSGTNDEFISSDGSWYSFDDGLFTYTGDGKGCLFRNDVHTGSLEIVKENEGSNIFKDKITNGSWLSEKSMWQVTLKSTGEKVRYVKNGTLKGGTASYLVTKDSSGSSEPMKIGKNGRLILDGLPYGEYLVEEVTADTSEYVLEKFTCVISENSSYGKYGYSAEGKYDDVYTYSIFNKLIENRIKISKVNGETGKRVISEGTKVRVRYMGNPSLADPASAKNYGKLLPNAADINSSTYGDEFILDGNGEFVIKYPLQYGIYRVEEFCVPDGYFIGTYDDEGNPSSLDMGKGNYSSEGNLVTTDYVGAAGTKYENLVPIHDVKTGKLITFKEAEDVINMYTFEVKEESAHENGNFGIRVDYDGERTDADPAYSETDYPYTRMYHTVKAANNQVKGQIEVIKTGETLTGWKEETDKKTGLKIMKPIYSAGMHIKGAVFGIFAAIDELLDDGSDGPRFVDNEDNPIEIPMEKSTHSKAADTLIKDILGNEYTESIYEMGSVSLDCGGKLWSLLERKVSEENMKKYLYVTPEARPSEYAYTYEFEDGDNTYRFDITCTMSYNAGGDNLTDVKIVKTTVPKNARKAIGKSSYVSEDGKRIKEITGGPSLPEIKIDGKTPYIMGGDSGNELKSYMEGRNLGTGTLTGYDEEGQPIYSHDNDANGSGNELDYSYEGYIFHADGNEALDWSGNSRDFGELSEERYLPKDYELYILTDEDLTLRKEKISGKEEFIFEDKNENGVKDADEEYVEKTDFEWKNDVTLKEKSLPGDPAVAVSEEKKLLLTKEKYSVLTTSYIQKAEKVSYEESPLWVESDEDGKPVSEADEEVLKMEKKGWYEIAFSGEPLKDVRYILMEKDGEKAVLVRGKDGKLSWNECDEYGNFENALVEVIGIKFRQAAGNEYGFEASMDGFRVSSAADKSKAVTRIDKQNKSIVPTAFVGAGYMREKDSDGDTFTAKDGIPPVALMGDDGVKTEVSARGDWTKAVLTIPLEAVDSDFDLVTPRIRLARINGEGELEKSNIDWYSKLSSDKPELKAYSSDSLAVTSRQVKGTKSEPMHYEVEILTKNGSDAPVLITYSDGYTSRIYQDETEGGSNIGVMYVENIYRTQRYALSDLVEVITTGDDGSASSSMLPLGKYIVRELNGGKGFVTDGTAMEAVLSYENQNVPYVWTSKSFENKAVKTEINLKKAFETSFGSGDFRPGEGAVFGVFSAEEKAGIKGDTLVAAAEPDENGNCMVQEKLPEGIYYISELKTRPGYGLIKDKLYFEIQDEIAEDETRFEFEEDGTAGEIYLNGKGEVKAVFAVLSRYPMPSVEIDGREYSLDKDVEEEKITIDCEKDASVVTVDVTDEMNLILPGGKAVTLKVTDDGYEGSIDGKSFSYTPSVNKTYISASLEAEFEADTKEDFSDEITEAQLNIGGEIIKAKVIHKPKTHDEDGVLTGDKDKNRQQIYIHSAEIDGKTLEAGDETSFDAGKIHVSVSLDKYGMIRIYAFGETSEDVTAEINGENVSDDRLCFVKNETLKRQSGKTEYLEINVNSDKALENRVERGTIEITKEDMVTGEVLPGAVFEIWSAGEVGTRNKVIYKGITGDDGKMTLLTDFGTYYYHETKAPNGYACDNGYYRIDVHSARVSAKAAVVDKRAEYVPQSSPSAPEIRTLAADSETDQHIACADDKVTIVDKVSYRNLKPGKEYLLKGVLMDKATGEPVMIKDREVTAESYFVPSEKNGTAEVMFIFDGRSLAGRNVVVFERLYTDDEESPVAVHEDIDDEGQTVGFPELHTSAADSETGNKISYGDESVTIEDTVKYENLATGIQYMVKGYLVDKKTGEKIPETDREKTFIAAAQSGEVRMEFTFDGRKLTGRDVVAFERLEYKGETVAIHEDLSDKEQTVHIPFIMTTAGVEEGYIIDEVKYSNLLPGTEYSVWGYLVDKETGEPFLRDGEKVKAYSLFTPDSKDGSVTVKFRYEGDMEGKTFVVFENVYINNRHKVASHEDIDSEEQTVELSEAEPLGTGHPVRTGFALHLVLWFILGLAAVSAIVLLRLKRAE